MSFELWVELPSGGKGVGEREREERSSSIREAVSCTSRATKLANESSSASPYGDTDSLRTEGALVGGAEVGGAEVACESDCCEDWELDRAAAGAGGPTRVYGCIYKNRRNHSECIHTHTSRDPQPFHFYTQRVIT